jgi:hypothetical protein
VKAESKIISRKKAQGDAKGETSTLVYFVPFCGKFLTQL